MTESAFDKESNFDSTEVEAEYSENIPGTDVAGVITAETTTKKI